MKLKDAIASYRLNRQVLDDRLQAYTKKRDEAVKLSTAAGGTGLSEQAAAWQAAIDETQDLFDQNQQVLDGLTDQYCNVMNEVTARQQADAVADIGVEYGRIMLTISRMCAGDRVPAGDERKVMDFDPKVYTMAKNLQAIMAAQKKKQKDYESAWDDDGEEEEPADPIEKADSTEAQGELPSIEIPEEAADPAGDTGTGTAEQSM